eukprot:692140-Rhodomonas_salina.5
MVAVQRVLPTASVGCYVERKAMRASYASALQPLPGSIIRGESVPGVRRQIPVLCTNICYVITGHRIARA